ncbi:MAG: hypothetical protein CL489_08865 [Acidobacteria bacterium]|nr:hypothetical protein [Acidobacteriota bacterium]
MLNNSEIETIENQVREYNKTVDTDENTSTRVSMGYSNEKIQDQRIPNLKHMRLCTDLNQIEDERLRLQIKRDYALMSKRFNDMRDKCEHLKNDIYDTFPTQITRLTKDVRDQLENENRLFYVNDGNQYIILPFPVEKIIDNKN